MIEYYVYMLAPAWGTALAIGLIFLLDALG